MRAALFAVVVVPCVALRSAVCSAARRPVLMQSAVLDAADAEVVYENALTTVRVSLGDRAYPIYVGEGALASVPWQRHVRGKRAVVITNDLVGPLYLQSVVDSLSDGVEVCTLVLPDGEEYKSMEMLNRILDFALEEKLDRACTFVALGGGVIGDIVGFAAAVYQRGVDFVQIPTTLMAMVDSSVGGKTAVNHAKGKNMIGAFYQPNCVVIDTSTLLTLPDREYASGVAEIIKYGLIRDAEFFEWLETNMEALMARESAIVMQAIEYSCRNKAYVVAADERETANLRATLNLGHTFGHAIETSSGYGVWLHGEAVAIGTVMAADLSKRLGWIDDALFDRTLALLRRANLPTALPSDAPIDADALEALMAIDKKVENGQLRLILCKGPLGECAFTADFDAAKLRETLEAFAPQAC